MALTLKNKNSHTSLNNTIYTLPSYKKQNYNANKRHPHSIISPISDKTGSALAAVDSSPWYTKQSISQTSVRTSKPSFPPRQHHWNTVNKSAHWKQFQHNNHKHIYPSPHIPKNTTKLHAKHTKHSKHTQHHPGWRLQRKGVGLACLQPGHRQRTENRRTNKQFNHPQ